ncbi:MAG: hypothetical protein AB8G11_15815 [Saprospiraceae bacterium]
MLQHKRLINRAESQGMTITDVSKMMQRDAAIITHKNQSELVIDGVPMSWLNVSSQFYCDNKQLTKLAYEAIDIPYPKSIIFDSPDEKALIDFFENGQLYICKPLDSTNGIGVELDIDSFEKVNLYYKNYKLLNTRFLLEEYAAGKDLRIQVIGGKIVAACIREPAFVTGNGKNTIQELMNIRQAVMTKQNPNNRLEVDEATMELLKKQQLTINDIPKKNRHVRLKYVSNIAQGGLPIDVTNEIHEDFHRWATDLSAYLGTGYMGLDFMTTNHTENPYLYTKILEINARADWVHHTFSEVRTHDIAKIILKHLFQ